MGSGKTDETIIPVDLVGLAKEWALYYLRNWYVIGALATIFAISGVLLAWFQKPKYQARATFALEESSGSLSGVLGIAAEFGFNLGAGKDIFSGDNILQITTSRRIVEETLLTNDTVNGKVVTLAEAFMQSMKFRKSLEAHPRLKSIAFLPGEQRSSFSYLQDSILFELQKKVTASLAAYRPDKKLNIFEISFTSGDERLSKIFVERLLNQTTAFYTDLRSKRSRQTLDVLQRRVDSIKGILNSSITSRAGMQDANVNPAFAAAQAPLQRKQLDITVYGAAYTELFKNLELARFQYLQDVPLFQVIDGPRYPMKKIKLGRLYTGILAGMIGAFFAFVLLGLRKPRQVLSVENGSEAGT